MNCMVARRHIHACMDGELNLLQILAVEEHCAACAACGRIHAQNAAARTILRGHATRHIAPAALRARVRQQVVASGRCGWRSWLPALARPSFGSALTLTWPSTGAALAFAAVIMWGIAAHFFGLAAGNRLPEEIVSSHVRALMSGQLAEIVSSNPQDIKPWLAGKLGYSPRVDDLAPHGYALVGGRTDYVRERRVAALVYRHLGHAINVFAWPATARDQPLHAFSRKGYNLVNWTYDGMFFCAVSDLDHAELAAFARMHERDSE